MSSALVFKAFRLQRCTMGGSEWEYVVYTDPCVAEIIAKEKTEEWADYKVHEVNVRLLSKFEGAIDHDLVTIDRTTKDELLRRNALKKLTAEERKALGL